MSKMLDESVNKNKNNKKPTQERRLSTLRLQLTFTFTFTSEFRLKILPEMYPSFYTFAIAALAVLASLTTIVLSVPVNQTEIRVHTSSAPFKRAESTKLPPRNRAATREPKTRFCNTTIAGRESRTRDHRIAEITSS